MSSYSIGCYNNIFVWNIRHCKDYYCVVIGMSIGNGFDDDLFSKYIKNNIKFKDNWYCINTPEYIDIDMIADKFDRIRDIKHEKFWIKEHLKEIINPKNYKNFGWYLKEIKKRIKTIYWLK